MFNSSKLTRRNTQTAVDKHAAIDEKQLLNATVVGQVSKGECQMINRVLLSSTSIHGNLDAVPHACTDPAPGEAPVPYRASHGYGWLARRATKWQGAVEWPAGTIQQHTEEHITGGDITHGECAALAKHLAKTFGTLGLLPAACAGTFDN